jgi:hypothetical protein
MSIPGSPTKTRQDFLDNIPMAHLFDETEKEQVNVSVLMDELKALGIKGTPKDYVPNP